MEYEEYEHEDAALELLRHAIVQGDQASWAELQHSLGGIVLNWLHGHPRRKVACRWESEEHYVALVLERFRQATVQGHIAYKTLAGALAYLRASLNGAILDTLRAYAQPREVPLPEPGAPGQPYFEYRTDSSEMWEILQRMLPSEREQRLAYLLYHCGLGPREILQLCLQEWNDIQEIVRLRHTILERLLHHTNSLAVE